MPLRRLRRASFACLIALASAIPATVHAQDAADRAAVHRAVLDYVEGFYTGDSTLLVRSVHPSVFKYGFWRGSDTAQYRGMQMPWSDFATVARRVRITDAERLAREPREITLFDVQDATASAKLRAHWGTDYMLLGKVDGRWMITHILWQSLPTRALAAATRLNADTRAVLGVVATMFDGMREADSAKVRSTFASGARFAGVDPRATPPAIRFDAVDGWIGAIATSGGRWDEQIYDAQVLVDGNIAHAWTPYTFYLDKKVRHCGVNTISLLRVDGAWKVTEVADTRRQGDCPDPLAGK